MNQDLVNRAHTHTHSTSQKHYLILQTANRGPPPPTISAQLLTCQHHISHTNCTKLCNRNRRFFFFGFKSLTSHTLTLALSRFLKFKNFLRIFKISTGPPGTYMYIKTSLKNNKTQQHKIKQTLSSSTVPFNLFLFQTAIFLSLSLSLSLSKKYTF